MYETAVTHRLVVFLVYSSSMMNGGVSDQAGMLADERAAALLNDSSVEQTRYSHREWCGVELTKQFTSIVSLLLLPFCSSYSSQLHWIYI